MLHITEWDRDGLERDESGIKSSGARSFIQMRQVGGGTYRTTREGTTATRNSIWRKILGAYICWSKATYHVLCCLYPLLALSLSCYSQMDRKWVYQQIWQTGIQLCPVCEPSFHFTCSTRVWPTRCYGYWTGDCWGCSKISYFKLYTEILIDE